MEVVLCKLTLDTLDTGLELYLKEHLNGAKVIVAKCIGCCGDCTTHYVALKDGQPVVAASKEELLQYLLA